MPKFPWSKGEEGPSRPPQASIGVMLAERAQVDPRQIILENVAELNKVTANYTRNRSRMILNEAGDELLRQSIQTIVARFSERHSEAAVVSVMQAARRLEPEGDGFVAYLRACDFHAGALALMEKSFDHVKSGGELTNDQLRNVEIAVERSRQMRGEGSPNAPSHLESQLYDTASILMLDSLRTPSTPDGIVSKARLYHEIIKGDADEFRNEVKDLIASQLRLEKNPVAHISADVLIHFRAMQHKEGLTDTQQDIREACIDTLVLNYETAAAKVQSPDTDHATRATARAQAKSLQRMCEAVGVEFTATANPGRGPELDGKRLTDARNATRQVSADLPIPIRGKNSVASRLTLSGVAFAGIASVAMSGPAAAAEETTTYVVPTTEEIESPEVLPSDQPTDIIDPVETEAQPEGAQPTESHVENPENSDTPEQTDPTISTPSAQATPENKIEVDPGEFEDSEIEDPDIKEDILKKEQRSTGWDRSAYLENTINKLSKVFERYNVQAVERSPYIDDVEALIAEYDSYISSGGSELSPQQIKDYRALTIWAQIYARYPSFTAFSDESRQVSDSDFIRLRMRILHEGDLNPDDATITLPDGQIINLYTPEQHRAIERLMAGAYQMVIDKTDEQDLLELYQDAINPPKSKEKKSHENKQDHSQSHETLSDKEIYLKAIDKMEKMGPMWENRAKVLRSFIRRDFEPYQGAGAIGNFCVEAAGCELNPAISQFGSGNGKGVVQWGNKTVRELDRFGYDFPGQPGIEHVGTLRWFAHHWGGGAENWNKLDVQIGFIHWELNHTQKAAGTALRNSSNLYEATDVILNQYERPAERIIKPRLDPARATLDMFNKLVDDVEKEIEKTRSKDKTKNIKTGYLEAHVSIQNRLEKIARDSGHVSEDAPNGQSGFVPASELSKIGKKWGEASLQKDAATSFRILAREFEAEFGKPLLITGGYRDYQTQVGLKEEKPDLAAKPGTSEHGWGMAVDISTDIVKDWNTPEYRWLLKHADDFGWEKPEWSKFGKDKPELWHWEYEGGLKIKFKGNVKSNGKSPGTPANHEVSVREKMPVSRSGFTTPVDPELYDTITATWGGYENISGFHTGTDWGVSFVPVRAVKAGEIISVDPLGSTGIQNITLKTEDGEYVDYEHLSKIDVKLGDHVEIGEYIGVSGNSGAPKYSTGPHLHVSVSTTASVEGRDTPNVENLTKDPEHFFPSQKMVKDWLKKNQKAA